MPPIAPIAVESRGVLTILVNYVVMRLVRRGNVGLPGRSSWAT